MKWLKDPYFEVSIHGGNTSFFVGVNGVDIYREFSRTGQVSATFPVNQFFRNGDNQLSVQVYPAKEEGSINPKAFVTIELWVSPNDNYAEKVKVCDISFKGTGQDEERGVGRSSSTGKFDSTKNMELSETGDVEVFDIKITEDQVKYKGCLNIVRELNIPNQLPLWGFFEGDALPDYELIYADNPEACFADRHDLFPEYEKIQNALAKKNKKAIDEIMPMFAERNRETDLAFYKEPGTTEKELRADFLRVVKSLNRKLVPLVEKKIGMTREDNGKLLALTRGVCKSAIVFNYVFNKGATRFNIIFYRKDGAWIISR